MQPAIHGVSQVILKGNKWFNFYYEKMSYPKTVKKHYFLPLQSSNLSFKKFIMNLLVV